MLTSFFLRSYPSPKNETRRDELQWLETKSLSTLSPSDNLTSFTYFFQRKILGKNISGKRINIRKWLIVRGRKKTSSTKERCLFLASHSTEEKNRKRARLDLVSGIVSLIHWVKPWTNFHWGILFDPKYEEVQEYQCTTKNNNSVHTANNAVNNSNQQHRILWNYILTSKSY